MGSPFENRYNEVDRILIEYDRLRVEKERGWEMRCVELRMEHPELLPLFDEVNAEML